MVGDFMNDTGSYFREILSTPNLSVYNRLLGMLLCTYIIIQAGETPCKSNDDV